MNAGFRRVHRRVNRKHAALLRLLLSVHSNSNSTVQCVHTFDNTACVNVCIMYGHAYSKSMDQPGKVDNPARGQLSRENECFPVRVRA